MTHNEARIQRYKEEAIAALRRLSKEDDIESFDAAVRALNNMQPYLNLSAKDYAIR